MTEDYTIIRSPKRKRTVALHVQPDGSLCVMAPQRTSLRWIEEFIRERKDWIARRRAKLQAAPIRPSLPLEDGGRLPFYGNELTLSLQLDSQQKGPTTSYNMETGLLRISLPSELSPEMRQEEIRTEILLWLKKKAREILPSRVEHWSEVMGLRPTRLSLTNPKHQWGSCNSRNEIRLNWRLILAEPELVDYVIVHELCHIPHKDHGPHFWSLCANILPDMAKRRRALRKWEELHHPSDYP